MVENKIKAGMSRFGKFILFVILAGIILWATIYFAQKVPDFGIAKPAATINVDLRWYTQVPAFMLGIRGTVDISALIISLMIFLIMFVAISDILQMFSTFSEGVSWIIGFAIAGIAGVGGAVTVVSQIFGVAAGISAAGIALIIFGSLAAAVTLNLGIGGRMRQWRSERQAEVEGMKSEKGASKVANAIKGLKKVEESLAE